VLFILGWLHLNFKNKLGLTPQKEAEMHLFFLRLDFFVRSKKSATKLKTYFTNNFVLKILCDLVSELLKFHEKKGF